MNFKTLFVNQLGAYFRMHRDKSGPTDPTAPDYDPDQDRTVPIEIEAVNVQSDTPVNPESYTNARPAIFLAYGDTGKVQGQEFVGADYETFTVLIYAHVNSSSPTEKDLVKRQGDMDTLVRKAVKWVRSIPPDGIFLENAYIGRVTTDKGLLGRYAFMQFEIVFLYQSDIDL